MDGVRIDYSGNQKKTFKVIRVTIRKKTKFRVIQSMNYCRNNAFLARGGLPTGFFLLILRFFPAIGISPYFKRTATPRKITKSLRKSF